MTEMPESRRAEMLTAWQREQDENRDLDFEARLLHELRNPPKTPLLDAFYLLVGTAALCFGLWLVVRNLWTALFGGQGG